MYKCIIYVSYIIMEAFSFILHIDVLTRYLNVYDKVLDTLRYNIMLRRIQFCTCIRYQTGSRFGVI